MQSDLGKIMQLGYIVEDVAKAANEWAERLGVGPFYMLDRMEIDEYYYRGVRTDLEMCLAFGYWGDMQIELIQPLNDADTFYSRALKDAPGELNHCCTVVSGLDALVASRNLQSKVIHSGASSTGVKFVYLEEYLPGGLHLELAEMPESALQAYAGMKAVTQSWDGKNLLRPMTAIGEDIAALS